MTEVRYAVFMVGWLVWMVFMVVIATLAMPVLMFWLLLGKKKICWLFN